MTYKEFTKWCEENGYNVFDSGDGVYVSTGLVVSRLGHVYKGRSNSMHATGYEQIANDLFAKMVELASTPIEEREEPKKYIVKVPKDDSEVFYALRESGELRFMFHDHDPDLANHYELTEDQIMEIDERFMAFAVEVEE